MRPSKRFDTSPDERNSAPSKRFVGKSRYSNAPPVVAGPPLDDDTVGEELELQVGDVTFVVRQDPADLPRSWDKYALRPVGKVVSDADLEATEANEEIKPVYDLTLEDDIPEWGPWHSESVSAGGVFHRTESRFRS